MIRSRVVASLALLWFLLADLIILPGHTGIYLPISPTGNVDQTLSQQGDGQAHKNHYPDDCQICKLTGQFVSIPCETVKVVVETPAEQVFLSPICISASIDLILNSVRAPPSFS